MCLCIILAHTKGTLLQEYVNCNSCTYFAILYFSNMGLRTTRIWNPLGIFSVQYYILSIVSRNPQRCYITQINKIKEMTYKCNFKFRSMNHVIPSVATQSNWLIRRNTMRHSERRSCFMEKKQRNGFLSLRTCGPKMWKMWPHALQKYRSLVRFRHPS